MHTKGKLTAEEVMESGEGIGWHILRDKNGREFGSGDGGFDKADAERLALCWNSHDALVETNAELLKAVLMLRDIAREAISEFNIPELNDLIEKHKAKTD